MMKTAYEIAQENSAVDMYGKPDKSVLDAMEEYAKQEAIYFTKWVHINNYHYQENHDTWMNPALSIRFKWTNDQLYKKFKDENNTRNKGRGSRAVQGLRR